jgi:thiol-disulfide isomerase/thioredoxin
MLGRGFYQFSAGLDSPDSSGTDKSPAFDVLDLFKHHRHHRGAYHRLARASFNPSDLKNGEARDSGLEALMEPPEKKIEWRADVLKAYDEAVRERKPLIVEFGTDWCDYCKELDQKVLSHPAIQSLSDKAIFVRANPEKDSAALDLAKQLKVIGDTPDSGDGYPTVVVMDAQPGVLKERGRVVGLLPLEKFMAQLKAHLPASAQPQDADRQVVDNQRPERQPLLPDETKNQPDGSQEDGSSFTDALAYLFPSWAPVFGDLLDLATPSSGDLDHDDPRHCHKQHVV